jgi:putative DNA primase/helicase
MTSSYIRATVAASQADLAAYESKLLLTNQGAATPALLLPDEVLFNQPSAHEASSVIPEFHDEQLSAAWVKWPPGYEARTDGLYFVDDAEKPSVRLTGPFKLLGLARSPQGQKWSLLLEWADRDGCVHRDLIPRGELLSTGADVFKPLMSAGLEISPGVRQLKLLREALAGVDCAGRVRLVSRTGWYDGAFVLPNQTIGLGTASTERIIFDGYGDVARYGQAGTLEKWIETIARPAAMNSRLILALCAAFEGPVGELLREEGGGLHFVGSSSIGKTTLLRTAGSVWGGGRGGFVQTWRTTDNALEGIAKAHSGTLLALDEIGELDSRKAGEVAYMLVNGQAKGRMKADGALRERAEFRVGVLSSGEQSLEEKIAEAGHKAKAGQLLRVIDIPADAGRGFGLFDDPMGTDPGAFARSLKAASNQFYGTAGPAFVEVLAANLDTVTVAARTLARATTQRLLNLAPNATGQIERVAARLGLIAAAGKLAQEALGLPWREQECEKAADVCFLAWLENRGGTASGEIVAARAAIREAIERDGEARFRNLDLRYASEFPVRDLLGYRRTYQDDVLWCFTSSGLKQVLRGIAKVSYVIAALHEEDLLVSSPSDRSHRFSLKVDGRVIHTYAIKDTIVGAEVVSR